MIKDALQYIYGLTKESLESKREQIGETLYNIKPGGVMERIKAPPIKDAIAVNTLTGIESLLTGPTEDLTPVDGAILGDGGAWLIHVVSPTEVHVRSSLSFLNSGERETFVVAKVQHAGFQFNSFMDQETFVIGMLACFEQSDDFASVMRVIGNLRGEKVHTDEDDGFTQLATVKQGAKMQSAEIKNPVTLRPYRTFYDVPQPTGQYVLRLRQEKDETPTVALIEVRNNAWQHQAMESIRAFFAEHCPAYQVVC